MSVLIELVKLATKNRTASSEAGRIKTVNTIAKERCILFRQVTAHLGCSSHPEKLSMIVVKANLHKLYNIEMSDFCCEPFRKRVEDRLDLIKHMGWQARKSVRSY